MRSLVKVLSIMGLIGLATFTVSSARAGGDLSSEEQKLYNLLNEYRNQAGLPDIPLSPSLTQVAQTHVRDLDTYPPQGACNLHSWSENGQWTACCYTPDHNEAQCMWDKPRELTRYSGNGYEIACGGTSRLDAEGALDCWKSSPSHNGVILNEGIWTDPWQAVGVGIYQGYAVVWFGEEVDLGENTANPSQDDVQPLPRRGSNRDFDPFPYPRRGSDRFPR